MVIIGGYVVWVYALQNVVEYGNEAERMRREQRLSGAYIRNLPFWAEMCSKKSTDSHYFPKVL